MSGIGGGWPRRSCPCFYVAAVMFPDDDLVLDVCTINTVFSVMKAYGLLMAQPSLCDAHWWVAVWWFV